MPGESPEVLEPVLEDVMNHARVNVQISVDEYIAEACHRGYPCCELGRQHTPLAQRKHDSGIVIGHLSAEGS